MARPSQQNSIPPPFTSRMIPHVAMPISMVLLLVFINILWGGSSLAAKIGLASLPPMTLAFARFSLAAVLMYGLARLRRVDLRVSRQDWGGFWALGLLGLSLTYLLTYAGIRLTTATDASVLIATEPVYLALLSFVFLRERISMSKVWGVASGLLGVFLIITHGSFVLGLHGNVLGDLMIALGLVFEAASSIVGKGLVAKYPAITVMTYQMTIGALALAPFAVFDLTHAVALGGSLHFTISSLLSLFYLVIPCTVFAYTVWFSVLDRRSASEMSVFLFIQPVFGALLGVVFLNEHFTAFTVAGAAFVLLSLGLIRRSEQMVELPPSA